MKQVLIINITRMGDLIQMGPLLARLRHEWPDVAVDLVVDRRFAPVASLLSGLRHVMEWDFQGLAETCRANVKSLVALHQETAAWARPLVDARYDRLVNLTFDKRSGFLTRYIGAPDIRGVTATADGTIQVKNPWMSYFTDLHRHRRSNRFNLVDLYALGGSGPGPFAPLSLKVDPAATDWARRFLRDPGFGFQVSRSQLATRNSKPATPTRWIAVQVGASDAMKAWRPEHFGTTMAQISRHAPHEFVLIGAEQERAAAAEALRAYRAAGGVSPVSNLVGRTTLPQLVGLLKTSSLLVTNDTGPMHLAVAAGTPVINLSVGHVDFRETGPYGPGHWVIQADLACAPCGFDQVCPHQACKDRIDCDQVAALCLHVLGHGAFPTRITGMRIYESMVDEDALGSFRLRAGVENPVAAWYGTFWRRYWYEAFTAQASHVAFPAGPAPDHEDLARLFDRMTAKIANLVTQAERVRRLAEQTPPPVAALQEAQHRLREERHRATQEALQSLATSPPTVAFIRQIHNDDGATLAEMARHHIQAYRSWAAEMEQVRRLCLPAGGSEGRSAVPDSYAPVMQPAQSPVSHTTVNTGAIPCA